jgi:mono/diheme cytochrome c family protein
LFRDGRALQTPPAGTVARQQAIGPSDYAEGMHLDNYVDHIPVPIDLALIERGQQRFEIFCAACHGLLGDGDSKVAENMTLRRPRSLHDPEVRQYPPGRIYRVITHGYGLMPAIGWQLPIGDRWAVVAYVRALQLSQSAELAALPEPVRREAQEALQ